MNEKTASDVTMNRPVHLARRDKTYDEFLAMLRRVSLRLSSRRRLAVVRRMITLLNASLRSARLALRGRKGRKVERDFLKYIELHLDAADAVRAMTRCEADLEDDLSLLKKLVGSDSKRLLSLVVGYRKRGWEVILGMRDIATGAKRMAKDLREENLNSLEGDDLRRYQLAYRSRWFNSARPGRAD